MKSKKAKKNIKKQPFSKKEIRGIVILAIILIITAIFANFLFFIGVILLLMAWYFHHKM